jgi:hypothetical protein
MATFRARQWHVRLGSDAKVVATGAPPPIPRARMVFHVDAIGVTADPDAHRSHQELLHRGQQALHRAPETEGAEPSPMGCES